MEIFDCIKKRCSYRGGYLSDRPSKDDLIKIVQTGIDAPSGSNQQTTSFIIVNDEVVMDKLRALVPNSAMNSAPSAIVILAELRRTDYAREDYSAAVQNILLAITALGYATVWIDGQLRYNNVAQDVGRLLNVADGFTVTVVLPVGIPSEELTHHEKKAFDKRAFFNKMK